MPVFSKRSQERLATCRPELSLVFNEVVKHWDCTILSGRRDREEQDELYAQGRSQLKFPYSKHNTYPLSTAVDVAPWRSVAPHINWEDKCEFYAFARYVLIVAQQLGISLRWGGDWDSDWDYREESFFDGVHFELAGDDA